MAGFAPARGSSVRSTTYKQSENKCDSLLTCAHVGCRVLVMKLSTQRILDIGTQGACGLIALAAVVKKGATPMLRYDKSGKNATHAAAKLDGQMINLGSDDRMVEVSVEELRRACREDFDPSRLNLQPGELKSVLQYLEIV